MKRFSLRVVLLCIATVLPVQAQELVAAGQALCEKLKSCAVAEMEGQELTPDTRQMMQPMLDNLCTQVLGEISKVPAAHPLYTPAVACMQSMHALSCERMRNPDQAVTPACEAYEKLARESVEAT